ncbi:tyrosine-type recombinase/integrase [Dyella sp. 2YAF14]|uniref:tyrosine-type recombinase/integrase n=1 Tax=Dyella sp. 2YAF14 TaxID=3233025 RepID=UPI003F939C39
MIHHESMVPNNVRRKVAPASREQVSLILDACLTVAKTTFCQARNEAMVVTLADTGIRREELTWMRRQDLQRAFEDGGRMPVRCSKRKGNPFRLVPLAPETLRLLRDYESIARAIQVKALRKKGHIAGDWLFCTRTGTQLTAASISELFGDLRKAAGIDERMTAHMLRHRYITLQIVKRLKALNQDRSLGLEAVTTVLSQVASLSGHASLESLWGYMDWAYEGSIEGVLTSGDANAEAQTILATLVQEFDAEGRNEIVETLTRVRALVAAQGHHAALPSVLTHERAGAAYQRRRSPL